MSRGPKKPRRLLPSPRIEDPASTHAASQMCRTMPPTRVWNLLDSGRIHRLPRNSNLPRTPRFPRRAALRRKLVAADFFNLYVVVLEQFVHILARWIPALLLQSWLSLWTLFVLTPVLAVAEPLSVESINRVLEEVVHLLSSQGNMIPVKSLQLIIRCRNLRSFFSGLKGLPESLLLQIDKRRAACLSRKHFPWRFYCAVSAGLVVVARRKAASD